MIISSPQIYKSHIKIIRIFDTVSNYMIVILKIHKEVKMIELYHVLNLNWNRIKCLATLL